METSNDTSQSGYIPTQDFRVIPECQDYMMFENDVRTSNNNTYQCTDQACSAPQSSHEAHGHELNIPGEFDYNIIANYNIINIQDIMKCYN